MLVCLAQGSLSSLFGRRQIHRLFKAILLLLTFNFAILIVTVSKVLQRTASLKFSWFSLDPTETQFFVNGPWILKNNICLSGIKYMYNFAFNVLFISIQIDIDYSVWHK